MQPINTNTFPSLLSGMFDGGAPTQEATAVEMSAAEIQDSIRASNNRVFRESIIPASSGGRPAPSVSHEDASWKGPPAPSLVGGTIASWDGYSQDPIFKGYWDSEFYTPNRNNNWQDNETPWSGYYDGMEVSGGSPTERGYFNQYLDSIGRSDLYAKPENVTPNPGQKYVESPTTQKYTLDINPERGSLLSQLASAYGGQTHQEWDGFSRAPRRFTQGFTDFFTGEGYYADPRPTYLDGPWEISASPIPSPPGINKPRSKPGQQDWLYHQPVPPDLIVDTRGMQPINTNTFPSLVSGMFGGDATTTGNTNAGGKGVGDIVPANPNISSSLQQPIKNLINFQPASSLLQGAGNRPGQPYVYGDLGLTTSDYSIWGSKGNPYITGGPGYNPGRRWGAPILPQPIVPVSPTQGGDDSPVPDWVDPNSAESQAESYDDLQNWLDRDRTNWEVGSSLLGVPLLPPAIDLMYGINPYTQQSFSWYDGSTDDFGYVGSDNTLEGKDLSAAVAAYDLDFEAGMTDLSQDEYIAQYMAERDASNATAQPVPGWWEGRWGSSKDPLAIQAQQAIATANAEAAAAIQAEADAEQAKLDAEQARWDEQYAQINNLNTEQISLMNDIKSDIQDQYGTFQDEILSQVAAENASMFDSFAEYKEWMGEKFTTQQSGLDEALAIAAATNEGLNSMQIDLMNTIAEDMQNQYGALSAEILSQVSAENAAMFDSLEEYQQWMADDADTAPATIADAVEAGKPFGQEGDDTWSPDGHNIYHGPGHNWNTPDSENTASPGTVTPPPAPTDPFGGGMDDLDWGSGGDDGGDDFDSNEEASDNYDDFGGDWGDWD